jgi:hypothetical protein
MDLDEIDPKWMSSNSQAERPYFCLPTVWLAERGGFGALPCNPQRKYPLGIVREGGLWP